MTAAIHVSMAVARMAMIPAGRAPKPKTANRPAPPNRPAPMPACLPFCDSSALASSISARTSCEVWSESSLTSSPIGFSCRSFRPVVSGMACLLAGWGGGDRSRPTYPAAAGGEPALDLRSSAMGARVFDEAWREAPPDPEPWRWSWRAGLLSEALASLRPGARWLDLVCGAVRFLTLAPGAIGVDVAPAALEQ